MAEVRVISGAQLVVVPMPSMDVDGTLRPEGLAAIGIRNSRQTHVLFHVMDLGVSREPGFRVNCDFEPDTSQGRITIWDADGHTELYLPVRQGVPILREILAAYEARLAELP